MRRLAGTLAITISGAFLIFPFLFVVLTGSFDEEDGFLAPVVMMFFIQFISPFPFWIAPLLVGSLSGILWRLFNMDIGRGRS